MSVRAGVPTEAVERAREARAMLDLAARLGWRGVGRVEPNPAVGCVIVRTGAGPARERIIGMGHHRVFGGPHAEAEALAACRARGEDPAGATVYVTLEPCAAAGKQPACVEALIAARVGRVVYARGDPSEGKGGGAARLRAAGIEATECGASAAAVELAAPFVKRAATGLPWVIAKWAQTIDGRVATRTGESRWISNERSRRWVHLTRGRVEAVLTGIGTVKADDPRLTAREVPVRRRAIRVVIDPGMEMGAGSAMLRDREGPEVVRLVGRGAARGREGPTEEGTIVPIEEAAGVRWLDLRAGLAWLRAERGVSTVLCECGPGFTGRLIGEGLVDELQVYIAPMVMGDAEAKPAARGLETARLAGVARWRPVMSRSIGDDRLVVYRRV